MTEVSGLCGLESLWLLAQNLGAVTDVHIMICLQKICSESYIKTAVGVCFCFCFLNVSLPLLDNDHFLSFCWALELCSVYFFKVFAFGFFPFPKSNLHQLFS